MMLLFCFGQFLWLPRCKKKYISIFDSCYPCWFESFDHTHTFKACVMCADLTTDTFKESELFIARWSNSIKDTIQYSTDTGDWVCLCCFCEFTWCAYCIIIQVVDGIQAMGESGEVKLVLVVNNELKMGKGKIAAQVLYSVLKISFLSFQVLILYF